MKSFALAALAFVGFAAAQGVTEQIAPPGVAPPGSVTSMAGKFEVTIVELSKRDAIPMEKRDTCGGSDILVLTLKDGVLTDALGRAGYIASNYQFQFDAPPQAGAIYTAGFSVGTNGSLALGPSATFYACASGDFYNLYDRHWAPQCSAVHILVMPCGEGTEAQLPDGQIVATTMVTTTLVTVLPDGQPQAIPTVVPVPVCQIPDGQPQMHTTPCASLPPMITPKPGKPVSQIPDGQIQVPPPSTTVMVPPVTTGPSVTVPKSTPTAGPSVPTGVSPPGASAPPVTAGASNIASSSLVALVIGVFGAVLAL